LSTHALNDGECDFGEAQDNVDVPALAGPQFLHDGAATDGVGSHLNPP
jgi:hypothetical protein